MVFSFKSVFLTFVEKGKGYFLFYVMISEKDEVIEKRLERMRTMVEIIPGVQKFFVNDAFKAWSENGDVKKCNGYGEVLKFIEGIVGDEEWELYRFNFNKKFEPQFSLTLKDKGFTKE